MTTKIKNRKSNVFFFIALFLVSNLVACSRNDKEIDNDKKLYPVVIFNELPLGDLLDQPVKIKIVDDIRLSLDQDWYAGVSVKSNNTEQSIRKVKNCRDYFSAAEQGLIPVKEYENSAYQEFARMCDAANAIINAKPSSKSFLSSLTLDDTFPNKMPKQLAMVISLSEYQRILKNNSLNYWSDVNQIIGFDKRTEHRAIYKQQGGSQDIQLITKGDFNGDGIEDLLMTSRDTVEGGSYNATRMFLITKTSIDTDYTVLKEYQ